MSGATDAAEQEQELSPLDQDSSLSQEPTIAAIQPSSSVHQSGSVAHSHRPSLSLTSLADLVRSQSPDPPGTSAAEAYAYTDEEGDEGPDSPRASSVQEALQQQHGDAADAPGDRGGSTDSWSRGEAAQPSERGAGTMGGHLEEAVGEPDLAAAVALQASTLTLSVHNSGHARTSQGGASQPSTPSSQPQHQHQQQEQRHHQRHTSLADRSLSAALEDDSQASWLHHLKHFFILSSSGKPIYSYHGEENALAGLMALITALVSVVQDQGDSLHHMVSGSTLIVFVTRGPLLLVAASRLGEPIMALQRQLELLYRQVLLVVTTGLERLILRNPAYDPRSLLQGVGSTLQALVHQVRLDPAYLLGALRPFPLPSSDRAAAQQILAEALKGSPAYYALLMVGSHIIAYERAKQQPALEPLDVLLLSNFITSNPACRSGAGEVFCPVCLPGYNPDAFLHAHIHYFERDACSDGGAAGGTDAVGVASSAHTGAASSDPAGPGPSSLQGAGPGAGAGTGPGVYLVLLAGSSETFHQLSAACGAVKQQLGKQTLLQRVLASEAQALQAAAAAAATAASLAPGRAVNGGVALPVSRSVSDADAGVGASGSGYGGPESLPGDVGVTGHVSIEALPKPVGGRFGSTPLWHFLARFPGRHQMLAALPCPVYCSLGARQQLACAYAQLYSLVLDCPDPTRPNRVVWLATDSQAMLASLDSDVELYLVLDPLCDEITATQVADGLRKHLLDKRVLADLLLQ